MGRQSEGNKNSKEQQNERDKHTVMALMQTADSCVTDFMGRKNEENWRTPNRMSVRSTVINGFREALRVLMLCTPTCSNHWWTSSEYNYCIFVFCPFSHETFLP